MDFSRGGGGIVRSNIFFILIALLYAVTSRRIEGRGELNLEEVGGMMKD